MRRLTSPVRSFVVSSAFVEGWAHYAEEMAIEEGFAAGEEKIAIGVWLEALVRVTRLACAIGVHTAGMTVEQAAQRFEADTHLSGPAALSEARRATFDPTYGRYTWGKLEILKLRERARKDWATGFTLQRFHKALMDWDNEKLLADIRPPLPAAAPKKKTFNSSAPSSSATTSPISWARAKRC